MLAIFAIALVFILISGLSSFNTTNLKYDEQPVFVKNQHKYALGADPDDGTGDDDRWGDIDFGDDDNWD